jgi:hypothetical protein
MPLDMGADIAVVAMAGTADMGIVAMAAASAVTAGGEVPAAMAAAASARDLREALKGPNLVDSWLAAAQQFLAL